jgi:hypothetical protein
MHLLFQTKPCDRTVLLSDPSDRIGEVVASVFGRILPGATVREVSSPDDPPWGREPPPWVRAGWYRAVWLGLSPAERRCLALVASPEAVRMWHLDPARCRSIVAVVDPLRTHGFRRPVEQWTAAGDVLAGVSAAPQSAEGVAAVDELAETMTLVAADDPLGLVSAVGEALGVAAKRSARIAEKLRRDWPSFGPSRRPPHWLDVELYARGSAVAAAVGSAAPEAVGRTNRASDP